jgi:hypothetical protein
MVWSAASPDTDWLWAGVWRSCLHRSCFDRVSLPCCHKFQYMDMMYLCVFKDDGVCTTGGIVSVVSGLMGYCMQAS